MFSSSLVVLISRALYLCKFRLVHAHLFMLNVEKLIVSYMFFIYSLAFLQGFLYMIVLLEESSHHLLESGLSTWQSFFKSNFLAYCARDEMAHLAHFQSPAGPETTRAILEECPAAHDMI